MLAISVRFLHGWTRLNGDGDLALMGMAGESGEWPPSPGRLFAALVAGGGTSKWRSIPSDDSELRAIEESTAPIVIADAPNGPDDNVILQPLHDRFVVLDENYSGKSKKDGGSEKIVGGYVQNYPARTSKTVRPGTRVAPRQPEVTYYWPDLTVSEKQFLALRLRAARVGYLGCSDSPTHVVVSDRAPALDSDRTWSPNELGNRALAVPFIGLLDVLNRRYEQFLAGRVPLGSTQPREFVRYAEPRSSDTLAWPEPIRVWAELDRSLPGQVVVSIAEALKGLVLTHFGEAPPVITGHGLPSGTDHARFLSLPFVGHKNANGRVYGLMVELPPATDPSIVRSVRAALSTRKLSVRGSTRSVSLSTNQSRFTAQSRAWAQTTNTWASAFPVVMDRFPKSGPTGADIGRLCEAAGLPVPVRYRVSRSPFMQGGVSLRPYQTIHGNNPTRPYFHLQLQFERPIRGPFVLGQMKSFGLGLMKPCENASDRSLNDEWESL